MRFVTPVNPSNPSLYPQTPARAGRTLCVERANHRPSRRLADGIIITRSSLLPPSVLPAHYPRKLLPLKVERTPTPPPSSAARSESLDFREVIKVDPQRWNLYAYPGIVYSWFLSCAARERRSSPGRRWKIHNA